ncbi:hypothetical protein N2152v2_011168 [Parachlorella kessleri]
MLRSCPLQRAAPAAAAAKRPQRRSTVCLAQPNNTKAKPQVDEDPAAVGGLGKLQVGSLGDLLGPIGITIGKDVNLREANWAEERAKGGILGAHPAERSVEHMGAVAFREDGDGVSDVPEGVDRPMRINRLSTDEWRSRYEKDGRVDLWVEDDFNAGSRVIGGSYVWKGGVAGFGSGEGPTAGDVPRHKVTIYNYHQDQTFELEVPEDRFVLYEAEDQGLELPYACRLGCCTACAVKVKEGEIWQPQALGISRELKEQGYALMCVGYPMTDLVLEVADEDEVYNMQFGSFFEEQALDPNAPSVQRDDFAIELALLDE